jgi:hypothetical protein
MNCDTHIQELEFLLAEQSNSHTALRAAIELMRACAPQDEAEERDHVRYVIERCAEAGGSFDALVMRERAAVRAECASTMGDLRWIIKQRDEQLTDAQAEIEELKRRTASRGESYGLGLRHGRAEREFVVQQAWDELKAARAEIERCAELETRLTNLRTAAEIYYARHGYSNRPSDEAFRTAINASK